MKLAIRQGGRIKASSAMHVGVSTFEWNIKHDSIVKVANKQFIMCLTWPWQKHCGNCLDLWPWLTAIRNNLSMLSGSFESIIISRVRRCYSMQLNKRKKKHSRKYFTGATVFIAHWRNVSRQQFILYLSWVLCLGKLNIWTVSCQLN